MQTFDQCLADLVTSGEVTFETAKSAASNPSDFELQMKMFSQSVTDEPPEEAAPAAAAPEVEGIQTGTLDFMSQ